MALRRAIRSPIRPRPLYPPLRTAIPAASPGRSLVGTQPPSLSVGGYSPDYEALIKADPDYMGFEAYKQQGLANAATNRGAAIKALAMRYGGLPKGFKDAFGDLTAGDLSAAAGNQFSEEANLERKYQQDQNAMRRSLAARGVLQSGDLGYGQGQLDTQRGSDEYSLGQQFLDALNQALQGYGDTVNDFAGQEVAAVGAARGHVQDLYKPTMPHDASYMQGSAEKYGFPVYRDSDGKLWKNGPGGPVPFTPPNAAPPAAAPAPAHTVSPVLAPVRRPGPREQ